MEAVEALLSALRADDVERARLLLHPYLHWDTGDGVVRGRTKVLALLEGGGVPAAPSSVELRDGQIYRWVR